MNIHIHSELSVHKFGGRVEDYYEIHKFIDSSKLFFFNAKHRAIFHHTFGIDICIQVFGDTVVNHDGGVCLVRDIAAEHVKEDLSGKVPTLKEWFEKNPDLFDPIEKIAAIQDHGLKSFVMQPYLNSGITSSCAITFSDFGVALTEKILGLDKAILLRSHVHENDTIASILKQFKFHSRWQYTPDMKQLALINKE